MSVDVFRYKAAMLITILRISLAKPIETTDKENPKHGTQCIFLIISCCCEKGSKNVCCWLIQFDPFFMPDYIMHVIWMSWYHSFCASVWRPLPLFISTISFGCNGWNSHSECWEKIGYFVYLSLISSAIICDDSQYCCRFTFLLSNALSHSQLEKYFLTQFMH